MSNMKFYVISIVAIFAALGIGIYIGITLDAQEFIVEQREGIATEIEERFDFLSEENSELKQLVEEIEIKNYNYKYFIDSTYEEIIKDKLIGTNVAIIETNNDYMYSGIGEILDIAGANVVNITTIDDKFINENLLKELNNQLQNPIQDDNIIKNTIDRLTKSIINGEETDLLIKLMDNRFIDVVGIVNDPIDYVIIAGGSIIEDEERLTLIDNTIVDISKDMSVPIVGVEKVKTNYSDIGAYKGFRINTVDNVDTTIGKVSLILVMEGRKGHYGIKETAERLVPSLSSPLVRYIEER